MKKNISQLHLEVLPAHTLKIFEQLAHSVPSKCVLGEGTSISLQLGHRISYDLDIFTFQPVVKSLLQNWRKFWNDFSIEVKPLVDNSDELTCIIGKAKVTMLFYPFKPLYPLVKTYSLPLFDLRDLAAAKAYTIGLRGVYRDYADLFVLLKNGMELKKIIMDCEKRFGSVFNAKLFLEQLIYFEDIEDYTIEWLQKPYQPAEIQQFLGQKIKAYLAKNN